MALNCGGRPPDPIQKSGYLLLKKSSHADMNMSMAIEASQEVVTTSSVLGRSGSMALNNMLTGSVPCNYLGPNSNDDYRAVSIVNGAAPGAYPISYAGGCRNSAPCPAATPHLQVGMDHYNYNHHEVKAAAQLPQNAAEVHFNFVDRSTSSHIDLRTPAPMLGPDHHRNCEGVKRPHVQQQAAEGYGHAGSSGHGTAVRLHKRADHCHTHNDRELGPGLQVQVSADHHQTYLEMSAGAMQTGWQNSQEDSHHHQAGYHIGKSVGAAVQMVVQMQGEADHHRGQNSIERAGNMEGKSVQQYMRMSQPGLSMSMMQGGEEEGSMSMEVEEGRGVYYGSSISGAGAGGSMQVEQMRAICMGDDNTVQGMKKTARRLTKEQVKSLEGSFKRESKLEAERKRELAQQLGLQPRQVAVWFQNRRARFKSKQLQREFDLLKHQYDAVRSHKDKLLAQVEKLKNMVGAQSKATPTNHIQGKGVLDANSSKKRKDVKATGPRKQQTTSADTGKQKTKSNKKALSNTGGVLPSDISGQPYAAMAIHLAPKSSIKGSFTLEVKPSLQVPHIEHHQPLERQMPTSTLSPSTKLSLCGPQQLFLHHMLAMKVDSDNFHLAQPEPHYNLYNDHYTIQDKEDGNESMLCFNSTWHHDP